MYRIKEVTKRKMQAIDDASKISYMIEKFLLNKPYFIKADVERKIVKAVSFTKPDIVQVQSEEPLSSLVILYNVFDKYVEFHTTVEQDMGDSTYTLRIHACNLATEKRKHDRYTVDRRAVTVNNIRVSRNAINASLFNIPTSVKVHFKQYQQILSGHADEVFVDAFDRSSDKFELVRKSKKILYLSDTQDEYCYDPHDEEKYVNYAKGMESDIHKIVLDYKAHKITSEMIVPIIYTGHDGIPIPLGFIQLRSKDGPIPEEKSAELQEIGAEMVRKMRDSNTVVIPDKQFVDNVSYGGLRLHVDNEELIRLLPEQSGITFDIVFKMTQAMTVFTETVYTIKVDDALMIGLKIVGHSTKSGDFDRYYAILDSMK